MDTGRLESYPGEFDGMGTGAKAGTLSQHVDELLQADSPDGEAMRAELRNGADELEAVLRQERGDN